MAINLNTKTCRVCLRFVIEAQGNCKSLFEIHNSSTISDSISLIANVKINENDGLPNNICAECLSELDTAINFKNKCERSNKLLHSADENEKNKCLASTTETPIPIELVKKEDASEDDMQYEEVDYLHEAESDWETKPEIDQVDTEIATEAKPVGSTEESEIALASSETFIPSLKISKAIDLKLECHDCGGSFKSKCKLRVHWKKVHMREKLICQFCKRTFKSFISLNNHLKKRPKSCLVASEPLLIIEGVGKSRVFRCKQCDYQSTAPDHLQIHFNIHTGNRPYICKLCSKGFSQRSSRDGHYERAHKIFKKQITCQYCGELVKGRDRIRSHLLKHTPATPVQCDVCKKMFKSKDTLKEHLHFHFAVKQHSCDKCDKSFYTKNRLYNHKTTAHRTEKIFYTCDICGFKVVRKKSLQNHRVKHTNANVACGVCGRFYPDAEELESHRKLHTKEKSICLECNRIFCNERSLKRHKIETHTHKENLLKEKPKNGKRTYIKRNK
ncbi:hypothetical protein ABMA28_012313 [Loxostege sticticalis]|uniref:Uncharacterized protein n=1 Tax=Loxostege sticticalis TaxID=481309 RepID=A0ABD0TMH6_LOXSC